MGSSHVQALTSLGQSILHRREFEGQNVDLGISRRELGIFLQGFREKIGMVRGGDDG